jgi:predicted DNA-binding transcriptional regulator AlpA
MPNDLTEGLLPGPLVCRRYQISQMTRWRWENDPDLKFPQPIRINRRSYWRIRDLEMWERAKVGRTPGRAA